jgi:hypothetical protein
MSNRLCLRCRNSNFSQCGLGYDKTEEQIIREQYNCFQERVNYINPNIYHPSVNIDVEVYLDEINYSQMKLHADMRKSERKLKKSDS